MSAIGWFLLALGVFSLMESAKRWTAYADAEERAVSFALGAILVLTGWFLMRP